MPADRRTGRSSLDKNRQGVIPVYYQQLYQKDGKLAVKTVGYIPNVDQTFGGTFSRKTPAPGRNVPAVREAEPAVDRQDAACRRSPASEQVTEAAAAEHAEPILRLRGIGRRFGGLHAVRDVDLDVAHGERRAILGPNGAGKTTLFNVISGDFPPTTGTIEFFGEDITTLPPRARAKLGMGRTYQKSRLFLGLSVEDNLYLAVLGVQRGHLRPVVLPAATASCASAARELAADGRPRRPRADARRLALARRAAPARGRDGARGRTRR